MAVTTVKGSVAVATSTGNQVIATGCANPKAAIFWATLQTAAGYATPARGFIGVAATGIQQRGIAWASDDNAATSNYGTYHSTTNGLCLISEWFRHGGRARRRHHPPASGDITVNWSNAPGSAWILHYLEFGGSTLTAKVTHHTSPTSTRQRRLHGCGLPTGSGPVPDPGANHVRG